MMIELREIIAYLESRFPLELAESWDNVGLLVGDRNRSVSRVLCCLTITPEIVREARDDSVDLLVSHHPFPFHAVKRITSDTPVGWMLGELLRASVAVYSPHTAHDNAESGINRQLADLLELREVEPLTLAAGRFGILDREIPFEQLLHKVKTALRLPFLQYVDCGKKFVSKIAIGCGAAGELLEYAVARSADVLFLGETRFHTYLEARANGVSLVLPGHFASERFAMDRLATQLGERFPELSCRASVRETDPLQWC